MPVVTALNPLPEQVVGVRAVVGAAFEHDPMLQWIFGGVEAAEHATAAWVGWFVEAFAAAGTVDVVLGSSEAEAVEGGRRLLVPAELRE